MYPLLYTIIRDTWSTYGLSFVDTWSTSALSLEGTADRVLDVPITRRAVLSWSLTLSGAEWQNRSLTSISANFATLFSMSSLACSLLPFSSNCTENCYYANSYTIDTLRVRIMEVKRVSLKGSRHFRVKPGLSIKTRLSAQPLIWKWFFHSHANKTHFHKKGFTLGLILKVRDFGTRKGPISSKRILKKFYSSQQHYPLHCLRFWFRVWSRNSYGNSRLRKSAMLHR